MFNFLLSIQFESPVEPDWKVVHPGGQLMHDCADSSGL